MSTLHVHPVNDLVEHDTDGEDGCVCGPEVRPVRQEDGSVGWLIVHRPLGVHPSDNA